MVYVFVFLNIYIIIYLFIMYIDIFLESNENHVLLWYAYLAWIRRVDFTWAIKKPNSNKVNK